MCFSIPIRLPNVILSVSAVRHRKTLGGLSGRKYVDSIQPVRTVLCPHSFLFNAQHETPRDTADGENNANLTNLAIKGIIGVKAMAEISDAVQQGSDAQYYKVRPTLPL